MRGIVLTVKAICERLDRIEYVLGIDHPTPAQAELDEWAEREAEDQP